MSSVAPTPGAVERLFLALWPDDVTRERCASIARNITSKSGKQVAPENIHITLSFLGSIDAATRACVENAATAAAFTPFTLTLDHVGFFPRPRVLWIGATTIPPELTQLVRELNAGVGACGVPLDRRPFAAHMTIMRKINTAPRVHLEPIAWRVQSFSLVKSDILQSGAVYTVQKTWPA